MDREERLKKAVALRYNEGEDNAPKVVASGKGDTASRIIKKAREAHVPVYEDATLVEMLTFLDINSEIPVELYQMVAEVLVFIYSLDKKYKTGSEKLQR